MQFNSTEAQQIAASGNLIGPPLGSSSTSSSSPSVTTEIGAIVGCVVGGVLGFLFIGVLIWRMMRRRGPSFENARLSMSSGLLNDSKGPTPAPVRMVAPVPQHPPHISYPSSTSRGIGKPENSSVNLVQHAPGNSRTSVSHCHATTGVGPTFTPPSMAPSMSVGQPSNEAQRMGSPSSRSMIARFGFRRGRNPRHTDAPSTLSQGRTRQNQIGMRQPTPYILPPLPQRSFPSAGRSTSNPQETPRINPSEHRSPETASPSLSQPISAVQAHTRQPFDTDINRMIVTTPPPMSSQMPEPPSYMASQAEKLGGATQASGEQYKAGTPTPRRTGGPLAPAPERKASTHDSLQEKD
jgi:hypothetical protein